MRGETVVGLFFLSVFAYVYFVVLPVADPPPDENDIDAIVLPLVFYFVVAFASGVCVLPYRILHRVFLSRLATYSDYI